MGNLRNIHRARQEPRPPCPPRNCYPKKVGSEPCRVFGMVQTIEMEGHSLGQASRDCDRLASCYPFLNHARNVGMVQKGPFSGNRPGEGEAPAEQAFPARQEPRPPRVCHPALNHAEMYALLLTKHTWRMLFMVETELGVPKGHRERGRKTRHGTKRAGLSDGLTIFRPALPKPSTGPLTAPFAPC